jgi:hypothetical protein
MDIPVELIGAVDAVAPELIWLPGVTAVGVGFREENGEFSDELAVRVLVADTSAVAAGVPAEIAGVAVCVVEFTVEALFAPDTIRYVDLPGGAQIQQAPLASGTLGAVVQDGNGELLGLSCHHVCGDPGTTMWQPSAPSLIVGNPPDLTDSLGEVVACESPATQTMGVPAGALLLLGRGIDAATVRLDEATNQGRTISHEIADGFGVIDATSSPHVGMFVNKRGSQSGPTSGQVVGVQLIVRWAAGQPPPNHAYVMSRQYEIFYDPFRCPDGIFSTGGDSGSVVLQDGTHTAIGLLWGGNRAGGTRAMMCDITTVEDRLGVSAVLP